MNLPAFFAGVRPLFGGELTQPQVDGINAILEAWAKSGETNPRYLAYLLATAKHETANTMQPIYERGPKAYFNKYEPGTKLGKALGNTQPGDGYRFRGDGFVQLTGRRNFARAGKALGIDLIANPEMAHEPGISAQILVRGCLEGWFTGRKLSDYPHDFVESRRVVNGTDRAVMIAGYAHSFLSALEKAD